MAEAPARKKVTINTLNAKMKKGEPITQLAAYDYRTAVVADRLGIDILCVSDTGGMILFGHQSTVKVSSLASAIVREPSGVCGLIAISEAPRSASGATSSAW